MMYRNKFLIVCFTVGVGVGVGVGVSVSDSVSVSISMTGQNQILTEQKSS
jgi:hypothetical protein